MKQPKPCPWCKKQPTIQPVHFVSYSCALAWVACENKYCPVRPVCYDGVDKLIIDNKMAEINKYQDSEFIIRKAQLMDWLKEKAVDRWNGYGE